MTYQDINDLIDRVENGDQDAIAEARALSAKLSKRANVRLSALEEKEYTSGHAYESAKYFLGEDLNRTKFSESKKLSGNDLIRNLELVNEFLNDPTSTVSYESERRAGFENMESIIPDDFSQKERRSFLRFLRSDAWKEYKATIYTRKNEKSPSESAKARQVLRGATAAIERGASVRDLNNLYEQYSKRTDPEYAKRLSPDYSIYDVFEEWEEF